MPSSGGGPSLSLSCDSPERLLWAESVIVPLFQSHVLSGLAMWLCYLRIEAGSGENPDAHTMLMPFVNERVLSSAVFPLVLCRFV